MGKQSRYTAAHILSTIVTSMATSGAARAVALSPGLPGSMAAPSIYGAGSGAADIGVPIEFSLFIWGVLLITFVCFLWLFVLMLRDHRQTRAEQSEQSAGAEPAHRQLDQPRTRGPALSWPAPRLQRRGSIGVMPLQRAQAGLHLPAALFAGWLGRLLRR